MEEKNKGFFHWECFVLLFRHFPKHEYTETTFHIQFIAQNLSHILSLFCTPTWPSQHVSENREYSKGGLQPVSKGTDNNAAINKLTSVFHASVLLLIMNFVITLSK